MSKILKSFLVLCGFAGVAFASPAGPPAGNPILNSAIYQRNSVMNIDTATIRASSITAFSNIPNLPQGININGAFYNSIGSSGGFDNTGTFRVVTSSSLPLSPMSSPFSAAGDGSTNDWAAIQLMFNFIHSRGTSTTVQFPGRTFKVNNNLIVDGTVTSIECDGTVFDFSSLASSTEAFTFGGNVPGAKSYFGQPYLTGINSMKGCQIIGPASTGTAVGISVWSASDPGSAHYEWQDNVIYNFNQGILVSSNSYLTRFTHNSLFALGICLKAPFTTNAGEGIIFNNGACFNSSTGVYHANANADIYIDNSSFDGISNNYFYHNGGGGLIVSKTHIEGNFSPDYTNAQIYLSTGATRNISFWTNDWILIKSTHSKPAFLLDGLANQFHMTDCYINGTASVSSATIEARMTGGKVSLFGNYSTMNDTFFNNVSGVYNYNVNDQANAGTWGQELNIKGVPNAKTTAAGDVGEVLSSAVGLAAPVRASTTGVLGDVTNKILTAGTWDITGAVCGSTSTIGGIFGAGIGDNSGSSSSGYAQGSTAFIVPTSTTTGVCITIPPIQVSTSISVTKFLKFYFTYAADTPYAYGFIQAERVQR